MGQNPQFSEGIKAWLSIVKQCNWDKPQDIVSEFGIKSIDLIGKRDNKPDTPSSNRVVFDIKGNHIRIIAKYQFHPKLKQSRLYIKWIGTHSQYDVLCKRNQQFDIESYD